LVVFFLLFWVFFSAGGGKQTREFQVIARAAGQMLLQGQLLLLLGIVFFSKFLVLFLFGNSAWRKILKYKINIKK
jgi:hypothetical protein